MVPAPADDVLGARLGVVVVVKGVAPGRYSVMAVQKGAESSSSGLRWQQRQQQQQQQQQQPQRQRRRLQPHKERWPWSMTPREDARVPAPHETPKPVAVSPAHLRLIERTQDLERNNVRLQRGLDALEAAIDAVLRSLKRPSSSSSVSMLSPPPSPDSACSRSPSPPPRPPSSLPSSPAPSSSWSSPPSSPGSVCDDSASGSDGEYGYLPYPSPGPYSPL